MNLRVNFDLNNGCQLRCRMCRPDGGPTPATQEVMPVERFREFVVPVLSAVDHYQFGCLSEPTVVPYFDQVIAGLPPEPKGLMNTNGVLLTKRVSTLMVESGKFALVKVSFDGAFRPTFERIRVGANQPIVIRNIEMAVENLGPGKVALVFTLQPDNVHEADLVVEMAHSMGAVGVYVQPDSRDFAWCAAQTETMQRMIEAGRENAIGVWGVGCLDPYHHTPNGCVMPGDSVGVIVNHAGGVLNFKFQPLFNLFEVGVDESIARLQNLC
jgi:sulfatase maturation enzyme AslB (radical SAM superfamily)